MKLNGLLIFLVLLMPLCLWGVPSVTLPFVLPEFEYRHPANDSLFRQGFIMPENLYSDSIIKNSASFYGGQHFLPARTLKPEPLPERKVSDWMIWAVIVSLGALAVAKLFYLHRAKQIIRATLGSRHFNMMERDGNLFDETPAWLLFVNFLTVLSLLATQTIYQTGLQQLTGEMAPIAVFIGIIGLLIMFIMAKWLLTVFFAWVFKTRKANRAYLKNIFLFNFLLGIILLPFVVYNAYNPSQTGLYLPWAIFLFLTVLKFLRGVAIGYAQAGYPAYYLILYLCAIELAPLLILAKAASMHLLPV